MDKVYLEKKSCSGCTACYSACPRQCITMVRDEEGFSYPQIDASACVSCGVCKNVCPMLNSSPRVKEKEEAFILRTKDYSTWKNSSSGGAFTEICRAFSES